MTNHPISLSNRHKDEPAESPSAERRNLADALAHERNVLRTMIDLIPAFIYAKDAQSRFTACNALVADRLGTVPAQMIGKTDFDFFPREMAEQFFADEQQLIKSGIPLIDHEEIAFDKTRGMERVILTSKVPLRDAAGNLTGIVGTGYDITERKAAEERMASSERLESIGRLAAGVAHEINTPIQYLSDTVKFIGEAVHELLVHMDRKDAAAATPAPPDDEVEYLRAELPPALTRVSEGLTRIAEIVRSMKAFSNADQREMSEVDLNHAIANTLVVARSEYQAVADVRTELGQLPLVFCHGGQINQVVLSLIINAAHTIAEANAGTGTRGLITITTRRDGGDALISVADTGCGIAENIRARIFDPFFSTKEVGRGGGQGLSIARNIVMKAHGGTIWFETKVGAGSTFHVRLPIREQVTNS